MKQHVQNLQKAIQPLREKLLNHKVYAAIHDVEDLNHLLESHVFAVWDFMSLLKSLQQNLTCVTIPWVPKSSPRVRRLINEIVLGEETDVDMQGVAASHFELYLDAMEESLADTTKIKALVEAISAGETVNNALKQIKAPKHVKTFVGFTFKVIRTKEVHKIAAAFTFGREDLIPDLFNEMVRNLDVIFPNKLKKLLYYLNRHIELDGDEHSHMAIEMLEELCQNDEKKWQECIEVAQEALRVRLVLWDGIYKAILKRKKDLVLY